MFQGRVVIPGQVRGQGVTRKDGFNVLENFLKEPVSIANKIVCTSAVVGSTTGGMLLQTAIAGVGSPKALLFSRSIDPLAAAGVLLADVWNGEKLVTIDQLGDEFLAVVRDGVELNVLADGRVEVLA